MDTIKRNDESAIWQNMMTENTKLTEIAVFIKRKYPNNLELEEIKEIVKLLVDEYEYTYDEIMHGVAVKTLLPMLGIKEAKKESVVKNDEVNYQMSPFKYAPKHVDSKTIIRRLFIGILTASTIFISANALIDNTKDANNALENISIATGEAFQRENTLSGTIVEQCMEVSGYNHGTPIYSLNIDLLVQKIEYLCSLNKDLFDSYLSNVYFDLESGRLDIMSTVLNKLQQDFSVSEDYQDLYNEIKDHGDYIDYMLSLGIIDPDRSDYTDIMNAINKYREYKKDSQNLYPYSSLTDVEQQQIDKIRDEYREYKNTQNYKNGDMLQKLSEIKLNEDFGGRTSGC